MSSLMMKSVLADVSDTKLQIIFKKNTFDMLERHLSTPISTTISNQNFLPQKNTIIFK